MSIEENALLLSAGNGTALMLNDTAQHLIETEVDVKDVNSGTRHSFQIGKVKEAELKTFPTDLKL